MNGPWTRWLAAIPVAAFFVAGCGSSLDISSFEPAAESGVQADTSTPGDDGGVTTDSGDPSTDASSDDTGTSGPDDAAPTDTAPPPDPLSLDNVCERLADAVCTPSFQSCCTTKGFAWAESGCRAAIAAGCGVEVTQVKEGKGTFAPEAFDACAAAWTSIATTCSVPLLDYLEAYTPCHELFPGTIAPGANGCSADSDCKVPAGSYAHCRDDGRCEAVVIAQKDETCNTTVTTFNKRYCDYGLYCSSTIASGTCREGKAIGASCLQSSECGTGRWCERTGASGKCVAGRGFNASCTFDAQCASGDCRTGKCTDPNVTAASPALCSGTAGGS